MHHCICFLEKQDIYDVIQQGFPYYMSHLTAIVFYFITGSSRRASIHNKILQTHQAEKINGCHVIVVRPAVRTYVRILIIVFLIMQTLLSKSTTKQNCFTRGRLVFHNSKLERLFLSKRMRNHKAEALENSKDSCHGKSTIIQTKMKNNSKNSNFKYLLSRLELLRDIMKRVRAVN